MSVLGHGYVIVPLTRTVGLTIAVTDEMTKAVTGLTIAQIGILRAIYEDTWGEDPACLTGSQIADLSHQRRKAQRKRR